MKRTTISIMALCILFWVACATPPKNGPNVDHGVGSVFTGLAHLVLSPFQITAGVLEGVSALPFYLATGIHDINRGLIQAQAKITLDDTYDSAYGKRIDQVPENGDTGEVFRRMKHATLYFQKVLKQYGVHDAEHYILASIDTANSQGYTLFSVVYRPRDTIEVHDKYDPSVLRKFSKQDRLFYEPYEKDASGAALDTIIDWAGLPRVCVQTQKAQAILITMAANAVVEKRKSPGYWEIEKSWIAGNYEQITEERGKRVRDRLNI